MADAPISDADLRAWIVQAVEAKAIDFKALSIAIGKNETYIQQYVRLAKPRRLHAEDKAEISARLASLSATAPASARAEILQPNTSAPFDVIVPDDSTMPQTVPVMGTAYGGDLDQMVMSGSIMHYVARPSLLIGRSGIFAVYLRGTSMVPWKKPGEVIYVDRDWRPLPGDHALIELKAQNADDSGDHGALVKQLISANSEFVILAQYSPYRDDIRVDRDEIRGMYRVLEQRDLLGT